MSNNKQSSVEFFKMKIVDIVEDYKDDIITLDEYIEQMKKVEEQAKAMHKEEIMKAFNKGHNMDQNNIWADAEWYYIVIFGG